MRECKIQVQILGLRNMDQTVLNLSSPSLHLYVQTTERWDSDPSGYKMTKDKSLPSPYEVNFQEQLELDVLLPDDEQYAPNLEFVVMDKEGFFITQQAVMCWGTVALRDFYPHGEKPDDDDAEEPDSDDEAAVKRREKAEKRKQFEDLVQLLLRQGTVSAKEQNKLLQTFKDVQGKNSELEQAFDLYMSAPSDEQFIQRTEDWLLKAEQQQILSNKKKEEDRIKKEEEKKRDKQKKEEKKARDEEKKQRLKAEADRKKAEAEQKKAEAKELKEQERLKKEEEKEQARLKREEEKALKVFVGDSVIVLVCECVFFHWGAESHQ